MQGYTECVQQGKDTPHFSVGMPATLEQVDQAPRDAGCISRLLLTPTVPRAGGAKSGQGQ